MVFCTHRYDGISTFYLYFYVTQTIIKMLQNLKKKIMIGSVSDDDTEIFCRIVKVLKIITGECVNFCFFQIQLKRNLMSQ